MPGYEPVHLNYKDTQGLVKFYVRRWETNLYMPKLGSAYLQKEGIYYQEKEMDDQENAGTVYLGHNSIFPGVPLQNEDSELDVSIDMHSNLAYHITLIKKRALLKPLSI